jgi:hypothetical protein
MGSAVGLRDDDSNDGVCTNSGFWGRGGLVEVSLEREYRSAMPAVPAVALTG